MSRQRNEAVDIDKGMRHFEVEAKLLDEGREDIRAGRCISGEAADAWIAGLDGAQDLPKIGLDSGRRPPPR
jgi:hypothetical protein